MSVARIGRVRMKSGGADVRVLHTPPAPRSRDVVRMLRETADNIASGKYASVDSGVFVAEFEDGAVEVFGWGGTNLLLSLGLLHLGIERLTRMRLADFEDRDGTAPPPDPAPLAG